MASLASRIAALAKTLKNHGWSGGDFTVPTQSPGDNSTKAASTAFVTAAVAAALTAIRDGVGTAFDTLAKLATGLNATTDRVTAIEGLPLFTKYFESDALAWSATGGTVTAAHGLGARPKIIHAFLRRKVANNGYAVGDEVPIEFTYGSSDNRGGVAFASDTLVGVVLCNAVRLPIRPGANSTFDSSTANWDIRVRAWL